MLNAAKTLEPPVHHDGQAGAEGLALLHAGVTREASAGGMGGQCQGYSGGRWGAGPPRPSPKCCGPITRDERGQQRVSQAPPAPRAPTKSHSLGTRELPPSHTALQVLAGTMGTEPPGPVRCEHHGATRFDDIQDEVPEEAPCLGVHPCGWLILGYRQHSQTCQPWEGPCHSLPVLSPAQATIPHSRRCVMCGEAGGGQLPPGLILPPSGRTRKMKAGYPMSAMAVDSFLLLPPL